MTAPETHPPITIGPIPDPKDYAVGTRLTLSFLGAFATFERAAAGWIVVASSCPETTPVRP